MTFLISSLFIIEFLLIALIFFYLLLNRGFTFKGGIAFGVLYFIFIPIWVLIIKGRIDIDKSGFSSTTLTDVILNTEAKTSLILIAYLFSLIIYLYSGSLFLKNKIKQLKQKHSINFYLIIYISTFVIIFIGSGLLKGGNWYDNRNTFFKEAGSLAVLIAFILGAARILIIAVLIYMWDSSKISSIKFLAYVSCFTLIDMFFSGNRIYIFITFVIIGLFIIKRHPLKSLILFPISIPFVAFLGYFGSIFRHMRGPLFLFGFPTPGIFISSFKRAIALEPFNFLTFFLNISESVNVNVIYNIFNHYDMVLGGATYLKTILFYVPRSFWLNKPESITVITANFFGSASLVTTIIGEMHMNFSYLGVILLPILLWITENMIRRFSSNDVFYGIISFFFGVLIFRMPYSDEILIFFFSVLMLYVSRIKFKNHFK